MIRAKLWFRCAVVHDPVTPVVVRPAVVGWEAKHRDIALTIERAFKGDELVRRMKGWVTVDPYQAIETVERFGRLKVLDERDLVIEFEDMAGFHGLEEALAARFGDQVDIELIKKP